MDETTQPAAPEQSTPEAEVIIPPDPSPSPPPDRSSTGTPEASDADAVDYDQLDYAAMLDEHGIDMPAGELSAIYPDARLANEFFQGSSVLDALEDSGVVSAAGGIRALAKLGADLRVWQAAKAKYLAMLPRGTQVKAPSLNEDQLAEARLDVVRTYLDEPAARQLERSGMAVDPDVIRALDRIARERAFYRSALPALEHSSATHAAQQDARRDAQTFGATRQSVQAMSEVEYNQTYDGLFTQWLAARDANNSLEREALSKRLMLLAEARYRR